MGGRHTAAKVGIVHHIIVIQRRQVNEFDDLRGKQNVAAIGITQFGGQQCEERSDALATRLQ